MGAFASLGNFLGGYAQARRQKHRDQQSDQEQSMNQAQQWANIADKASGPGGDAIREMATKNMQDLIVKYEKGVGEKHGVGAIIKFFKGDKKDSPALLGKLAPILAQRVQPESTPVPPPSAQYSDKAATSDQVVSKGSSQEIGQPQELPQVGEEAMRQQAQQGSGAASPIYQPQGQGDFNTLAAAQTGPLVTPTSSEPTQPSSGVTFNTLASGPSGPVDIFKQSDQYRTGNQGAVDRAKAISDVVAPGKSVFYPQYSGGTRYSPSYTEIQENELASKKKWAEEESKLNLENKTKLSDFEDRHSKKLQDDKYKELHATAAYANADQHGRDAMDLQVLGVQAPHLTEADLTPTGYSFKDGKIMAKTLNGPELDYTAKWKLANPSAARELDLMPADKKDLDLALRKGAEDEKAIAKVKEQLERAQILNLTEEAGYRKSLSAREGRIAYNTTLQLRKMNSKDAQDSLNRIDREWNIELNRLSHGMSGDPIDLLNQEGKRNSLGHPYTKIDDYKDDFFSHALGGIDPQRVRVKALTGIDPIDGVNLDIPEEVKVGLGGASGPGVSSLTSTSKKTGKEKPVSTASGGITGDQTKKSQEDLKNKMRSRGGLK